MKKIFAIVLALVMVFAMSATAFAAGELTETTTAASNPIQAYTTDNTSAKAVISLDVVFGELTFAYVNTSAQGVWDPTTHTYGAGEENTGVWQVEGDNTITVTNHSNRDVTVTVAAELDATTTNINAVLDKTEVTLAAGVENDPDNADKAVWTLTLTNTDVPTGLTETTATIGTVTVSITSIGTQNG